MENRFGLKDLFLFLLLVVLIVVVLLSMLQNDRQYKVLVEVKDSLRRQSSELADLGRTLKRGIPLTGATTQAGVTGLEPSPKGEPFYTITEAEAKPDFARGEWLVENYGVKFARLTPHGTMGDLYGTFVRSRIQEWLAYRDPVTLEYLPLLARDWQIKDNTAEWKKYVDEQKAADKSEEQIANDANAPVPVEITFQLRRGVTFSDGHPLTADDVVFSFDWTMNPAVEAPRQRAYYQKIRAVEKINDHEVVFKFREPYFEYFDLAASLDVMPKHFYEAQGVQKFNQSPGLLLGSGPYMMTDSVNWTPGTKLELVRNDRYWGAAATFDRIVYQEVEGDTAEMVMFKNGEVDRLACQPDQYKELLADQAVLDRSNHLEFRSPDSGYTFVGWNQQRNGKPTPFADKRVRQAMTLLTDRQRLIEELMLGYGSVASGPFTPLAKQANPNVKPWPFEPERAKSLLKDAGFEDRNKDGVLESSQGVPFRFKLTYNSSNDLVQRIALFLKDGYARAGIAMEPNPIDWTIMLKDMDSRNLDAITLAWSGGIESDIYQMFHSSQIKDAGDNFINYSNPELDRLMEEARSTVDAAERLQRWHRCHEILHEDQPYTFLIERMGLLFIDKRIQNVGLSKLGLNYAQRYVMPLPWYVPREMQKWQ